MRGVPLDSLAWPCVDGSGWEGGTPARTYWERSLTKRLLVFSSVELLGPGAFRAARQKRKSNSLWHFRTGWVVAGAFLSDCDEALQRELGASSFIEHALGCAND